MVFGHVRASAQLFLVAPVLATDTPAAESLTLGWDPSPDTNVTGYFLCWGLSSDTCTNLLDAGNATSTTVAGLDPSAVYYFTIVAYDGAGDQAPPSNMIVYPPGPTLNIQAAGGGAASGMVLSFQGNTGGVYSIEATLDFTNWATILTTNCSAAGPVVIQVADMADYPMRFYRLLSQ